VEQVAGNEQSRLLNYFSAGNIFRFRASYLRVGGGFSGYSKKVSNNNRIDKCGFITLLLL
jgi:hypothetical protein